MYVLLFINFTIDSTIIIIEYSKIRLRLILMKIDILIDSLKSNTVNRFLKFTSKFKIF